MTNFLRILAFITLMPLPASACIMATPMPTEADLEKAPAGTIAFSGTIQSVQGEDIRGGIPHRGFVATISVDKIIKGTANGSSLSITYGPCSPAFDVGSKVRVIARQSATGTWEALSGRL